MMHPNDARACTVDENYTEYDAMTELDWAEYEFATIEYDYNIHEKAARSIRAIFERLYKGNKYE